MTIQNYLEAQKIIKDAGGGDFEGPKPESLVAKAEGALELHFPPVILLNGTHEAVNFVYD